MPRRLKVVRAIIYLFAALAIVSNVLAFIFWGHHIINLLAAIFCLACLIVSVWVWRMINA